MSDVRAIAFYLPQFHPIPENDQWWGKGFTEWTNVSRAERWFDGHHQPHLPAELGFYDLRVPEVREAQAALAREHGIAGFCYYYYWFNGKRLLERPLDEVLRSGKPDFPFCICWANENWTRRWDGAESEVLMAQDHSEESDQRFILDALPILRDERYIRVAGKPILLVYRPGILPDAKRTTEIWRETARREGLGDLHLAAVQSFGLTDPRPLGFDSAVEFPPHGTDAPELGDVPGLRPEFRGKLFDYRDVVRAAVLKEPTPYRLYRGVMTSWDNTARRKGAGHVFTQSSPREYEVWLRAAIAFSERHHEKGEGLVFINAWNEWAEGTHLEPDQKYGREWLQATQRALKARSDWRGILDLVTRNPDLPQEILRAYVTDLAFALEAYDRSAKLLSKGPAAAQRIAVGAEAVSVAAQVPQILTDRSVGNDGFMHLDRVQGVVGKGPWRLRREVPTTLEGWAFAKGVEVRHADTQAYLVFRRPRSRQQLYAPLVSRNEREDVVRHYAGKVDVRYAASAGFRVTIDCAQVPPGRYEVGVVHASPEKAEAAFNGTLVEVG